MLGLTRSRILSISFLGFFSGLPLGLTSSTLQAWFTQENINIVTIGALSWIGLPYATKFLWAPLMDRYVPPFLGRRRGWIALTQILLCISLFILAQMNPAYHVKIMGFIAVMIAFISASQDIVIDAYRTDILSPNERGVGLASFVFAYRIAMLVAGGLALIFADHIGWRLTYEIMAVMMAMGALLTWFSPNDNQALGIKEEASLTHTVKEAFAKLFEHDSIVLILFFIVIYKLGDALVVSLTSNFLLKGLGFSLTDIGLSYKTVGLIATILGSFFGGFMLNQLGMYRGLWLFGLAQALSNFMFMFLAYVGKNYVLMVSSVFIEYFFAGMSSIAFFAFLTSLCHQQYSATQFACLSALASLGRIIVGPFAALMVEHLGWVNFYGLASLICFPPLFLLSFMRSKVKFNGLATV